MSRPDFQKAGLTAMRAALLSEYTTFRLGGPCRALVHCRTGGDVAAAVRILNSVGEPWLLVGGGSNLLVADAGVDRVVLRYADSPLVVQRTAASITVDAGAGLDELVQWSVEQGWAGLEFLTGIPGTIGGAIAGNAGAFGRSVSGPLASVGLLSRDGGRRTVPAGELGFTYRHSRLHETGEVVLAAAFKLTPGDRRVLAQEREKLQAFRRERHPDWHVQRTAGSYFRNIEPTSAAGPRQAAGWFLEQAGAKALRVGGARIFDKHANIIVVESGATARDVLELARRMSDAVEQRFGFRLQPEVRFIGDRSPNG